MAEVIELKLHGLSIRAISRLTGCDRKTIKGYPAEPSTRPVYGPKALEEIVYNQIKTVWRAFNERGEFVSGAIFLDYLLHWGFTLSTGEM